MILEFLRRNPAWCAPSSLPPASLARRFAVAIVLAALALTQAASWAGDNPPAIGDLKDYNVIYITIDALRAGHLGCHGYERDTSPFIDSLASKGMRFENARSNSSFTRESISVLFSGHLPSSSGAFGWYAQIPEELTTMAEVFRDNGYTTLCATNTVVLAGLTDGFQEVLHLPYTWLDSNESPKLSARGFELARRNRDKKFFMYLHYFDPHGPYEPPEEMYRRFAKDIFPNPLHVFEDVREGINELRADGFGPGDPRYEDMVLRYDAEIADTDRALEMLFLSLQAYGLLDKTLIVIAADHGEEFLDHGYVEHGWSLYEEVLRVPLILWAPGKVPACTVPAPVSLVDLLPTLTGLLGLKADLPRLDGSPLFKPSEQGFVFVPPDRPYVAELMLQERCMVRCVIQGDWKYLAARKWLAPSDRPLEVRRMKVIQTGLQNGDIKPIDIWGPPVHEELFNIADDPKEQKNLMSPDNPVIQPLKDILVRHSEACRGGGVETPSSQDMPDLKPEEVELLRDMGYL